MPYFQFKMLVWTNVFSPQIHFKWKKKKILEP